MITKKLTIIDNNAIWGVSVPKEIMLMEDERVSKVELIGNGKYKLNDFTEDFSVNVQIKIKNGLVLLKDGEEIRTTTPEQNIGRYEFTGPDANSSTKNPGIGAILMEKPITKEHPMFKFKTKVYQKPLPIGNYKDIVIYTFTSNGLAIDKVKP